MKPKFEPKSLPDGRVEMRLSFGEFPSLEDAKHAANETMRDLAYLWSLKQLKAELTTSATIDNETTEQLAEKHLREMCDQTAESMGLTKLWQESQAWPNFEKAWQTWRSAWGKWLGGSRRFPETKGQANTRYLWMKKQFLAGLRIGRGKKPGFYQDYQVLIFFAAQLGDVEFFRQFAEAKRRKIEPRKVQHCLMRAWMPAALWSQSQVSIAKFIQTKGNAWGNSPPANKGEAVRRAWELLGLWHDPKYRIKD